MAAELTAQAVRSDARWRAHEPDPAAADPVLRVLDTKPHFVRELVGYSIICPTNRKIPAIRRWLPPENQSWRLEVQETSTLIARQNYGEPRAAIIPNTASIDSNTEQTNSRVEIVQTA